MTSSGEVDFDKITVETDGLAKVRVIFGAFGQSAEGGRAISDGSKVVVLYPDDRGKYGPGSTYEAGKVSDVERYVVHEGDRSFDAWCPEAKPAGTDVVLKRKARHFTCVGGSDPDAPQFGATDLWLDDATGLIVKSKGADGAMTATTMELDAHLAADTFSVQPPVGASPAPSS